MFPAPNYVLKCESCGKKLFVYQDEKFFELNILPIRCPDCSEEMISEPISSENPFKKY